MGMIGTIPNRTLVADETNKLDMYGKTAAFCLCCCFILLLASCEWFQPARASDKGTGFSQEPLDELQGNRVYDPLTGEWRTVRQVSGKVDTVRWTVLPSDKFPPITTTTKFTNKSNPVSPNRPYAPAEKMAQTGGLYEVFMLLPFYSQRDDLSQMEPETRWGIQFYSGAQMAYEQLEQDGIRLNVHVNDTENSVHKLTKLMEDPDLAKADLIIGPYKKDQVGQLAKFAAANNTPMVVPFVAQFAMVKENPFYIQVNPSLRSHCEAQLAYIRRNHPDANVVLVVQDQPDEIERLSYFQAANALAADKDGTASPPLTEFIVSRDFNNIGVSRYIRQDKENVFVVPSWSSEPFIYSLLRQLIMQQSDDTDITVYGMPRWMDFEQIDLEYYERLNVHVSAASFVDRNDSRIREFNIRYFDRFGTLPREEAYLGYDVTTFFASMVDKWGRGFFKQLDKEVYQGLHSDFVFDKVTLKVGMSSEEPEGYDYMENKFVHILHFRNYHFQKANER
jgi:ABC-type branched-subunit amino acid transport system substrate-binding protein